MTAPIQEFKTFYRAHNKGSNEGALQDCQTAGYQALFMPQAAKACINNIVPWNHWATTPSLRITGRPTGEQEAFIIYWHQPTAFATPEGITAAKAQGLVNGAGRFDQAAFDQIYKLAVEQHQHLIIPHRKLLELISGPTTFEAGARDPRVIAFMDGQERVARYLPEHTQVYNPQNIGAGPCDDLDKDSPLVRLLCLGFNGDGGLYGYGDLDDDGLFVGVRHVSAEDSENLEESIEEIGDRFVKKLERSARERGYSV